MRDKSIDALNSVEYELTDRVKLTQDKVLDGSKIDAARAEGSNGIGEVKEKGVVVNSAQSEMTTFGRIQVEAGDPPCVARAGHQLESFRTDSFAAPWGTNRDERVVICAGADGVRNGYPNGQERVACSMKRRRVVGRL